MENLSRKYKFLKAKLLDFKLIDYLLVSYLIFIIFNLTIRQIFPSLNLNINILQRSINSLIQFSIIFLFLYKVIYERYSFKLNIFFKLFFILFFYSFFINLFIHQSSLYQLFDISYDESYYSKYLFNIVTCLIMSNQFILNDRTRKIGINTLILICISIGIQFLLTQFNIQNIGVRSTYLNEFGEVNSSYGRFTFLNWNENELSFLFSIGYSLLISKLINGTKKSKLFYFLSISASLIIFNAMILTGTRIGLIVICTSFIFIFIDLIYKGLLKGKVFFFFIFLLSTLIFRFYNFANPLKTRLIYSYDLLKEGKFYNWFESLKYGIEYPFKGIGISAYYEKLGVSLPENVFVEIFVTCGIIGLILLIFILFRFMKMNINYYLKEKQSENILLIICLLSAINSLNIVFMKFFWFALAICFTNLYKYNRLQKDFAKFENIHENNK